MERDKKNLIFAREGAKEIRNLKHEGTEKLKILTTKHTKGTKEKKIKDFRHRIYTEIGSIVVPYFAEGYEGLKKRQVLYFFA